MERLAGSIMLLSGARRVVVAFLAGAIGALALAPVDFLAAMFLAFPVLVWLLDGATGNPDSGFSRGFRSSFLIGWAFGFGYFTAGLWWLGAALLVEADQFAWALPLAVLGLPAVLALFYGLAAVLARLLWSEGFGRIAALAAAFGLAEWLRSFVATGFPWNSIGYAAMPVPLMMQSVHLVGLFGVSALAVFVFAAPALIATRRGRVPGLLIALLLVAAHLGYGAWRLAEPEGEVARTLTVRLVQPVVDQSEKIEGDDREAQFADLLALSALPPSEGRPLPEVIVWPETSVPFLLTENPDAFTRIADVLQPGQVLVAGAVRAEDRGAGYAPRYYNSVYAINDAGQVIGASDKVHLTPFGEYVPWEDLLRQLGFDNVISLPGGFSAAVDRTLLSLPDGLSLFPLICYEVIFPQEMTGAWRSADAVLNITNDGWFGATPGPYQHFQQARIRAVEHGLPVIRAANNGISAVINDKGQIISGLSLDQKASVDATLNLFSEQKSETDWRQQNLWLIIVFLVFLALISRRSFGLATN